MEASGASGGSPTGCGKQAGLNSARPTSKIFRLLRTSSGRCSSSSSSPRSLLWPGAAGESSAAADFFVARLRLAHLLLSSFRHRRSVSDLVGAVHPALVAAVLHLLHRRKHSLPVLFLQYDQRRSSVVLRDVERPARFGMGSLVELAVDDFGRRLGRVLPQDDQRRSRGHTARSRVTCSVADWSALPRRSAVDSIVSWSK